MKLCFRRPRDCGNSRRESLRASNNNHNPSHRIILFLRIRCCMFLGVLYNSTHFCCDLRLRCSLPSHLHNLTAVAPQTAPTSDLAEVYKRCERLVTRKMIATKCSSPPAPMSRWCSRADVITPAVPRNPPHHVFDRTRSAALCRPNLLRSSVLLHSHNRKTTAARVKRFTNQLVSIGRVCSIRLGRP